MDEEFVTNGIKPKLLSRLLTGKFRRGVTERFVSKEYSQALNIPY